MATTFLWHDYETFGVNPRYDRPAQFAAIRTDEQLQELGEPAMVYCKPALDYVPDLQACMITGITPQHCLEHGLAEFEFAHKIEGWMSEPDTVSLGYNSIRFDDEVTRFMFWRNLIDPYAREWQNGCSRWDLLDLVRTAYALRPQGIEWPVGEDGKTSFRLELLTRTNGLAHEAAHDALSDVRATIALARLIREKQPRLFDFCFALRKKDRVAQELRLPTTRESARPFLHISGMFPVDEGCLSVMWPLAMHPKNRNELLAWNLRYDPSELMDLSVEEIHTRLFTPTAQLPQGVSRLAMKGVHLNKSPMVIGNLKTLTPQMAERWGVDMDKIITHANKALALPDMSEVWARVYAPTEQGTVDVDEDLYGGFLGDEDRRRLQRLRQMTPDELAVDQTGFDDERLSELVFRYRARNFPQMLSAQDQQRWLAYCAKQVLYGGSSRRTVEQVQHQIEEMHASDQANQYDESRQEIVNALYEYTEYLVDQVSGALA